jgi:hypothetical protein
LQTVDEEMTILKGAVVKAIGSIDSLKPKVPEPNSFGGAKRFKELKNFM